MTLLSTWPASLFISLSKIGNFFITSLVVIGAAKVLSTFSEGVACASGPWNPKGFSQIMSNF
jgi:hypothetical protein